MNPLYKEKNCYIFGVASAKTAAAAMDIIFHSEISGTQKSFFKIFCFGSGENFMGSRALPYKLKFLLPVIITGKK